jgi:hypothetical protein
MKKLFILSLVVAFALLAGQAFASPPIAPPVEGFIIKSTTEIDATGDVVENESYNWTYFEGWGTGPFYPNGYEPVTPGPCGTDTCLPAGIGSYLVQERGFSEGAEIAYSQKFKADNGTTSFSKTFQAYSNPDAAAGQTNLMVDKKITYDAIDPAIDRATHEEKVGLSVISMGAVSSAGSPASGILSLCPWAAETNRGVPGGGYPATNEGIAAASAFKVSNILNFESKSRVNSTVLPALSYDVTAESGTGKIEAGFIVDLWEAPAGFVWAPVLMESVPYDPKNPGLNDGICVNCTTCACNPRAQYWIDPDTKVKHYGVWALPEAWGEPPLASRTAYKEYASADGTWSFTKNGSYSSVMPGAVAGGAFPINQVLVP